VRRSGNQSRGQLVLVLERRNPREPVEPSPKGLVEALADLLLEAAAGEGTAEKGGRDERQDHA